MQTLEKDIIEKFHQLEVEAQQRVLQTLTQSAQSTFDYDAWWADVEALQASIQSHLAEGETIDALSLLDDLREEAS